MRSASRGTLIVLVLVLWALGGPLYTALSDCPTMSSMCEAPCAIPACLNPPVVDIVIAPSSARVALPALTQGPQFVLAGLEPPPKPFRLTA